MFHTWVQKEGEIFTDFVADLRRLTKHCDFGPALNLMLWDRIVCGIKDASLQRRLLAEPVLDLCQVSETAENNARDLQASQLKVR